MLGLHWDVMEERARTFGTEVDRDLWRLVGLMHIADTKEQAYRDVEYGIVQWFNYFQHVAAFPQMSVGDARLVREMIDFVNESGLGSVGTVDQAGEQIERLTKQSGGFGGYLAAGARMGRSSGHAALLRADRPPRDAPVPRAGLEHAAGQGAGRGQSRAALGARA